MRKQKTRTVAPGARGSLQSGYRSRDCSSHTLCFAPSMPGKLGIVGSPSPWEKIRSQLVGVSEKRHDVFTMTWRFIFHKRNLEVGGPGLGCWFCGVHKPRPLYCFSLSTLGVLLTTRTLQSCWNSSHPSPHSKQEVARKQKDKWQTNSSNTKTWACLMILNLTIAFINVLTTTKTVSQPGNSADCSLAWSLQLAAHRPN